MYYQNITDCGIYHDSLLCIRGIVTPNQNQKTFPSFLRREGVGGGTQKIGRFFGFGREWSECSEAPSLESPCTSSVRRSTKPLRAPCVRSMQSIASRLKVGSRKGQYFCTNKRNRTLSVSLEGCLKT